MTKFYAKKNVKRWRVQQTKQYNIIISWKGLWHKQWDVATVLKIQFIKKTKTKNTVLWLESTW